jgi:hypothetical protein
VISLAPADPTLIGIPRWAGFGRAIPADPPRQSRSPQRCATMWRGPTSRRRSNSGRDVPRPYLSTRRHAGRQYQVRPEAILLINLDGYLRYTTQQDRISSVGRIMDCAHPHVVVTGASSGIGRAAAVRLVLQP